MDRTYSEVSSGHVTEGQNTAEVRTLNAVLVVTLISQSAPLNKKQCLDMSEQDIEHFLDQLHS